MKEIVSVIVPVYNAEKSIERCIASVISQTYKYIEIIVIDDGSNDKSGSIINNLWQDNKQIIYIRQENKGVSAARNKGIDSSSGKFVFFLDADDWIEEDCIENMISMMIKTNSDYCFSDWYVEGNFGTRIDSLNRDWNVYFDADELYRFYILNRYGCAPWGKLYRLDIIVENKISFIEGLPYAEDYLFILRYLSFASICSYINRPLLHYDCYEAGAGAKVRKNYFDLQVRVERYKHEIVRSSNKYKEYDDELLKISKLKSYVVSLAYLQLLYEGFDLCRSQAKEIINLINSECSRSLIKKANFSKINKIYAYLSFYKSDMAITLLTIFSVKIKRLVRS
ncbi:glycosyltransferase family 2 protein [Clostridium manihotivorum]|uniref:Glycosyltransferase 2-like domain-containing protein n=1 Tax=Clostridium manihotivorum TaxID=2320868 RepID=A0A410E071_9CLOT|nr:glycosyltransferase family 2 protein [Clostridium manihotivorum]QAA34732.1 hypothetical protein C1I91_25570 [Clostridium manihotivorum]